ncbi:hypothetical protein [Treponema primitia]|uniref:hypothetical protein n=1 Tax=Treponema primitia TaxID=88058 RepID=UPI000255519F|nr:hypothetical protein [Treponema primitia]
MLLTFQGFFEKGRFVSSEPVQVPEHKKVIVTVLDDAISPVTSEAVDNGKRQEAFEGLMEIIKNSEKTVPADFDYKKEYREYLDERYGNTN